MKKLILAAALTLSFSASASEKEEYCLAMSNLGKSFMVSNQKGVPLKLLYELIDRESSLSEKQKTGAKFVAEIAYSTPKYSSEKYKNEAINSFEKLVLLTCLSEEK